MLFFTFVYKTLSQVTPGDSGRGENRGGRDLEVEGGDQADVMDLLMTLQLRNET